MSFKTRLLGGGVSALFAVAAIVFLSEEEPGPAAPLKTEPVPAMQQKQVSAPPVVIDPEPEPVQQKAPEPAPTPSEAIELPERFTTYGELKRTLDSMGGCEIAGGPVGEMLDSWSEKWKQNIQDFAVSFNSSPPTDAYQTYSDETLQSLASGNDERAQVLLGHRAMADRRYDEAKQAYYRAAVLGSVDSPHFMIWILQEEKREAQKQNNIGKMVELTTEMVGWHRLLEKRAGVMYHPPSERGAWANVEKDERILAQAQALGHELYQAMSKERRALGLEQFEDYPRSFELDDMIEHIDCTPGA